MQDMAGGENNRTPVKYQVPDIYRKVPGPSTDTVLFRKRSDQTNYLIPSFAKSANFLIVPHHINGVATKRIKPRNAKHM